MIPDEILCCLTGLVKGEGFGMATKAPKEDDHAEMDAILKRMLETPPKPHDEKKKGRDPKPAPKNRTSR